MLYSIPAIEVIEKQIKKRDGTAFLWRLLVSLALLLNHFIMALKTCILLYDYDMIYLLRFWF